MRKITLKHILKLLYMNKGKEFTVDKISEMLNARSEDVNNILKSVRGITTEWMYDNCRLYYDTLQLGDVDIYYYTLK